MSFLQLIAVIFLLSIAAMCAREPIKSTDKYAVKSIYPKNSDNYIVQKGDSLYAIGFRFGIDYQQLAEWNEIEPPYWLEEGQSLKLSPPIKCVRLNPANVSPDDNQSNKVVNNIKKSDFEWQWPIKGKLIKAFAFDDNKGIDIAAKIGQTVYAAATGKVVYSGDNMAGYGNLLIIQHNNMYLSAYANNNKLLVNLGDEVKKGQSIAEVGSIGDKVCLHFEIRKTGAPVNPMDYLPDK
jgi:lipoprotein NlpD